MSDDFQSPPAAPPAPPVVGSEGPSDTGKILAAVGYIFWPVAVIAFLIEPYKNEKFVRMHALQALALGLAIWVLTVVLSAILIGFLVGIAGFVYQVILAVQVFNGKNPEVPGIYGFIKNYI